MLHAIMTWPSDAERRELFLSAGAAKAIEVAVNERGAVRARLTAPGQTIF
jgi:hypothetical protein